MANVTTTVLRQFSYKGETFREGDEIKMDAKHAARYIKLDFIKVDKEAEKKVQVATKENAASATKPTTKN